MPNPVRLVLVFPVFVALASLASQAHAQNGASPFNPNDPQYFKITGQDCWMHKSARTDLSVTWTGGCFEGRAAGPGTATYRDPSGRVVGTITGTQDHGVFRGPQVEDDITPTSHSHWETDFYEGKPSGDTIHDEYKNGKLVSHFEGVYLQGVQQGQGYAVTYADDGTKTSEFNGHWSYGTPDVPLNEATAGTSNVPTTQATSPPKSAPNPAATSGPNQPSGTAPDTRYITVARQKVLDAIIDPEMREDLEYVYLHDAPGPIQGDPKQGWRDIINGPEGYYWLGKMSCTLSFGELEDGKADGEPLYTIGMKWLRRAEQNGHHPNPKAFPQYGVVLDTADCSGGAQQRRQHAAANKESAEAAARAAERQAKEEADQRAFQKRLPVLLAERKKAGDVVCDTNGNSFDVDRVTGDQLYVSSQVRVVVGSKPSLIRGPMGEQWRVPIYRDEIDNAVLQYNRVYKCSEQ